MNVPGGLGPNEEPGEVIRGESRSSDCKDLREGQEEGGVPGPNPLGGTGGSSEEPGLTSPLPPKL